MLFKELIEGRYKAFSRMKDDERARNIGIVKYIENLASMAGVSIMEWNVAIFGKDESGKKLIDDKNEINRRFFEEIDKLAAAQPSGEGGAESDVITDAMKVAIKAAEVRHVTALIAKEQNNADAHMRSALDHYRKYDDMLKKAGEFQAAVRRLTGTGSGIEEQIRQVNAGNYWQFTGVNSNSGIEFVTKSDVVLTHKNQAAGVDININFGRFKATFSMTNFSLLVTGSDRNIYVNGYPHPHIQSSGSICWGTAAGPATRALAACSIVEPMMLLAAVLGAYNKDSPYVTMERFQELVGTPEEVFARDDMNRLRTATQVRFQAADAAPHNYDVRRAPLEPLPAVTPETNSVIAVAAEVVTPAPTRRRRATSRRSVAVPGGFVEINVEALESEF